MRVTRLSAYQYLSLENFEIPLGQKTILVGMNNAGKSNILSIPRFFQDAFLGGNYSVPVNRLGGFRAISRGQDDLQSISLGLEVQDEEQETRFVWTIELDQLNNALTARETIYEISRGESPRIILENAGEQRWHDAGNPTGGTGKTIRELDQEAPQDACMAPEACRGDRFPARGIADYIRAWRHIRPPGYRENKLRTMRRIDALPEDTQNMIINITRAITGWPTGPKPDGIAPSGNTVNVMEIAEALWGSRNPRLIIMDAPGQGLHPDAVDRLGEHLRHAPPEAQLLISTQNPQLVYQAADRAESIILIRDSQLDGVT